jgi:hypothetical protein
MDWIVVVSLLLAAGTLGLVLVLLGLSGEYRHRQLPGDGSDRSAAREEHWYALDEPMIIEKNPLEGPLS